MATFDDFKRISKETIEVDKKDRWTAQPVKFINRKNEYYGTFKGTANINNSVLSNCTFYTEDGVSVDINKVGKLDDRVTQLEFNALSLEDYVNTEVPKWIISAVSQSQDGIKDYVDNKVSTEKSNREYFDSQLCTYITDVSVALDQEISARERKDRQTDQRIDILCVDTFTAIETERKERKESDKEILNKLSDEVEAINEKIYHDKHYIIKDVDTDADIYSITDFCVNKLYQDVIDGLVYFGADKIGKIEGVRKDSAGLIEYFRFKVFQDNTKMTDHLKPGSTLIFSKDYNWICSGFDGCEVKCDWQGKTQDNLANAIIQISKGSSAYANLSDKDDLIIGCVINPLFNDIDMISGTVNLVPGKNSYLSAFDGRRFTFNEDNRKYKFTTEDMRRNGITVPRMEKNVYLLENIKSYKYVSVINTLNENLIVGEIREGNINTSMIKVTFERGIAPVELLGDYTLLSSENFDKIISTDYELKYEDSKLKLNRNHQIYQYKLPSDTPYNSFAKPNLENRKIGEADFTKLSVFFDNLELPGFASFSGVLNGNGDILSVSSNNVENDILKLVYSNSEKVLSARINYNEVGKPEFTKEYDLSEVVPTKAENVFDRIVQSQNISLTNPEYIEGDEADVSHCLCVGNLITPETTYKYSQPIQPQDDEINLIFPTCKYDDVSQEFIIEFFAAGNDGFVKVNAKEGEKVVAFDNVKEYELFVKKNTKTTFLFRKTGYYQDKPVYFVEDIGNDFDEHYIEELRKRLEWEISARISTDIELSNAVVIERTRIDDIYEIIKVIDNFKGLITLSTDYEPTVDGTGIRRLFLNNGKSDDDKLGANWFYRLNANGSKKHFTIDGKEAEDKYYLSITKNVLVKDLDATCFNITDVLDEGVFRLSANNIIRGDNEYFGIQNIHNLCSDNSQISTATILSADIFNTHVKDISVDSLSIDGDNLWIEDKNTSFNQIVNTLSSDLSIVNRHYFNRAISSDVKLSALIKTHESEPLLKTTITDKLLIVDEVTFKIYALTIRNGALNINYTGLSANESGYYK